MAKQTTITLLDDLDGGKADETVTFGLDGTTYEIDLSKKNAATLRKAVAAFKDAARKAPTASGPANRSVRRTSPAAARNGNTALIRDWAAANGYSVSTRGRISAAITAAYEAANG